MDDPREYSRGVAYYGYCIDDGTGYRTHSGLEVFTDEGEEEIIGTVDNGQWKKTWTGWGENRVYVYGRISGGEESGLVRLYTASSIEHEERRGLRRGG